VTTFTATFWWATLPARSANSRSVLPRHSRSAGAIAVGVYSNNASFTQTGGTVLATAYYLTLGQFSTPMARVTAHTRSRAEPSPPHRVCGSKRHRHRESIGRNADSDRNTLRCRRGRLTGQLQSQPRLWGAGRRCNEYIGPSAGSSVSSPERRTNTVGTSGSNANLILANDPANGSLSSSGTYNLSGGTLTVNGDATSVEATRAAGPGFLTSRTAAPR